MRASEVGGSSKQMFLTCIEMHTAPTKAKEGEGGECVQIEYGLCHADRTQYFFLGASCSNAAFPKGHLSSTYKYRGIFSAYLSYIESLGDR